MSDLGFILQEIFTMKKKEATALTRANLVTAFWTLYQEKRIEQISIKEITTIAGYNRSTFYEYFSDIYDILAYLEDMILNEIKEHITTMLPLSNDESIIQSFADIYDSQGNYLNILLGENGDPYFIYKLKSIISSSFSSALNISSEDIYSDFIYEFAISAIIGTLSYWLQHKNKITSKDLVILIRSMLTNGSLSEIQKHSTCNLLNDIKL